MIKNWCKDTYILLKSLYLVFGRHYLYGSLLAFLAQYYPLYLRYRSVYLHKRR